MVYFSVRLKANLIEFLHALPILVVRGWFSSPKNNTHKKNLIYKPCFLSTLHVDIINWCFSQHCEFSFLPSLFLWGWIPFSYLKSNWRSFITWLIKRLIFSISWHYGLWSAFMWFIVCNTQPQLTICAACLFPLLWSVSPLLRLSLCPLSARAADCPNLRLLHGGFPLLIGANSFGHLPDLSLLTCLPIQCGHTGH